MTNRFVTFYILGNFVNFEISLINGNRLDILSAYRSTVEFLCSSFAAVIKLVAQVYFSIIGEENLVNQFQGFL